MTDLRIGDTVAIITDPERGLYPTPSNHRAEVVRAINCAARILGADTTWASLKKADLRALWRRRLAELKEAGHVGARGASSTVGRILTVAAWLRDEELIPPHACLPPRKWKQVVHGEAGNPEPHRPRYTIEEMRKLLEVAPAIDPRLGLMAAIGAELRMGQVLRVRRSDVNLAERTVTVRGAGKKQGTIVSLTPGQYAALTFALTTGYLALVERRGIDYCLFPSGKLVEGQHGILRARMACLNKPIGRRAVGAWWNEAEQLAGIPHIEGRACYGVRRVAVDGFLALGISEKALQSAGGWSDIAIPHKVYASKDQPVARLEAADLRAKLRGEVAAVAA